MKKLFNDFFDKTVTTFVSTTAHDFKLKEGQNGLTDDDKDFLSDFIDIHLPVINILQVHGKEIVVLKTPEDARRYTMQQADAITTNLKDVFIAVRTADCLPVFIHDPVRKAISIVHAGWKSSQLNICGATVDRMIEIWGSDPRDLKAAFGPSIRLCSYEVTEEFRGYFPEEVVKCEDRLYLDLPKANQRQLLEKGVDPENIFDCGVDTFSSQEYYSFRRDGDHAGRMILLMKI